MAAWRARPKLKLTGKVAIVTGGGRGIGEAVAIEFAGQGAKVVVAARSRDEIEAVADKIRSGGGEACPIRCDVANHDDVKRLVITAFEYFGNIDVLVNAAGTYGPIGPAWDVDLDEWVHALNVNLIGTFTTCRAVLPHMITRRRGSIINFSGGGATAPLPGFSAYAASKAAVVRLTETLAEEVREFDISVNAIAPGAVDTRLQEAILAAGDRAGAIFERMRRLRESGEGGVPASLAAELAAFLASEDSGGLTGKLISAPHDRWQAWTPARINALKESPWLTLRRLDEHTVRPLFPLLDKPS